MGDSFTLSPLENRLVSIVVGFAISPEVAGLSCQALTAAHWLHCFIATLVRRGLDPEELKPNEVFPLVLFAFSHDYVRLHRRRARRLDSGQVIACMIAFFSFAERHLKFETAAACRDQLDFSAAPTILASAITDGLLGRTYSREGYPLSPCNR